MIQKYLADNFITLMILLALTVIMLVNRKKEQIPGTKHFIFVMVLLFVLTIIDALEAWFADPEWRTIFSHDPEMIPRLRMDMAALSYILRPFIIMIEVFVTAPRRKYRIFFAIPAVLNALIFATAFFGLRWAFYIDQGNRWHSGPLHYSIYFSQMFYVFLLAMFSIIYLKRNNIKRSAIVFLIVVQAILSAAMEYTNTLLGTADPITALCVLEYYFYMAANYRKEIQESLAEKELHITRQRMTLLQNQIRPHFIFNSLSIIRSLAKHDSTRAVSAIDSFSDYLKAHVYALRDEELIPFSEELSNTRAYLDLVQADTRRNIVVEYDLKEDSFMLPPLSLEPIVENSIKHGVGGQGGLVRIESYREDDMNVIRIVDNGTPQGGMTDQEVKRLGVGLDNTRKRLEMQCGGTLDINITDHGTTVTIRIPDRKE